VRSSRQSHDVLDMVFFFWPLLDLGLLREFFRHACHSMPTAIPEKTHTLQTLYIHFYPVMYNSFFNSLSL
jgi:hypothetical protein